MLLGIAEISVSGGSPVPDIIPVADAVFGRDDILVPGGVPGIGCSSDGDSYPVSERDLWLRHQRSPSRLH